MINLEGMLYSATYETLEGGGVAFILATAEHGVLFRLEMGRDDALNQVLAFAHALGLAVVKPL